jgi:hypothetical protein
MTEEIKTEQTPTLTDRINAVVNKMREDGSGPDEIMKAIDAEITKVWNDKENYFEFPVTLPKEIYSEQFDLLDRCREAIGFFDNDCAACGKCHRAKEVKDERGPLTAAEVFGHLIIEGTNALLERFERQKAETEARKAMNEFMDMLGKGGKSPEELMARFNESDTKKVLVKSVEDLSGLQALFNEMGEKGFTQFIEDHADPEERTEEKPEPEEKPEEK